MKIYFAVSVRAGRNDAPIYPEIVKLLKKYGEVLSERNGDPSFHGEINMTDKEIFDRDMDWLRSADVLVAEVTTPSLGVGYEISAASNIRKPVLCLYRKVPGKKISAMINGDTKLTVKIYKTVADLPEILKEFFK